MKTTTMTIMNETTKTLLFCLDKSNNLNLKQHLSHFSTRIFNDGKYLIKNILLSKRTEFNPSALVLCGDFNSIKEIVTNEHSQSIKIFIFCQNLTRQIYEPLINESRSTDHIVGLFTIMEDLQDALEDILIEATHERQLIRFITGNLETYLWYEFLKETSLKIYKNPPKQSIDISTINRQIEYEPLLSLYKLRSSIHNLSNRKISNKKILYGTVLKNSLIEKLEFNINNLISFNSFVTLEGYDRINEARHQSMQRCSRRYDETSIIFELESADQPTFKIIRVFRAGHDMNLWIAQLVGTHECVKLAKQFSYLKYTTLTITQPEQPETLFGQILMEMNQIDKAYEYFFHILIKQYEQLNKIYKTANDLWKHEENYNEAITQIIAEFQRIKVESSSNETENKRKNELTCLESDFDSTWETPIALEDANKINDLLAPISYQVDRVLCDRSISKQSITIYKSRRCILF